MVKPRAVAIYARISSDPTGTALGVRRQVEDCRRAAEGLGWPVADVYEDNDISAYSGKRRPAYEQMLTDLADGVIDGVVVWHIDRLTRRPAELEQFVAVLDAAKVTAVKFVTGDADLGTGDGLLMARIMGAVAAKESADKSRRLKRKMDELAAAGQITGGGPRPFGYEPDRVTIRETEAAVIRDLVARLLAGESAHSLAKCLTAQGVATSTGKPWRTPTLKQMLSSGRIAGLKEHRGEIIGEAVWPGIITVEEHRRVRALYATKTRTSRRTPQTYLLTGLLRCGRCGNRLYSAARTEKSGARRRRYVCSSGPDHGGCGRLTIVADPLEALITEAVLFRLDSPLVAAAVAGTASDDERTAELTRVVEATSQQLSELAEAYAARLITMSEWLQARRSIEDENSAAQRRLARLQDTDALQGLIGQGASLRTAWEETPLARRHAVIRAVLAEATIEPAAPGARVLDPNRVQPVWRA